MLRQSTRLRGDGGIELVQGMNGERERGRSPTTLGAMMSIDRGVISDTISNTAIMSSILIRIPYLPLHS